MSIKVWLALIKGKDNALVSPFSYFKEWEEEKELMPWGFNWLASANDTCGNELTQYPLTGFE